MPRARKAVLESPPSGDDFESNGVEARADGKQKKALITIPEIRRNRLRLHLIGDSGLICHKFSEKAQKAMADKQGKKGKQAKPARKPEDEAKATLYPMGKSKYGFPGIAFKSAVVTACSATEGMTKILARQTIHVIEDLVEIKGPYAKKPPTRCDPARIVNSWDLRYRCWFPEWNVWITIDYNANVISPEQIATLFNLAGYGVGVGDWRVERNGQMGRFHVGTAS